MLRFYYNGIREDRGQLQRCTYALGFAVPVSRHGDSLRMFAKQGTQFSAGVRAAFTVENDTGGGYAEADEILVERTHSLYREVKAAFDAMKAREAKKEAGRNERLRRQRRPASLSPAAKDRRGPV